ncbi:MAG: hypothetical protein ACLQU1_27715 [Bryobacteraceae bacterium]
MTKEESEELDRYANVQAQDALRYHNPPLDELTTRSVAEHIRDAWLDGYQAGKRSNREISN